MPLYINEFMEGEKKTTSSNPFTTHKGKCVLFSLKPLMETFQGFLFFFKLLIGCLSDLYYIITSRPCCANAQYIYCISCVAKLLKTLHIWRTCHS